MKEDSLYTFGNQFYSVKFLQSTFPRTDALGIKYLFYLEESVGHKYANGDIEYVPEYLVIFDHFVTLAKEYGLELVWTKNFHKLYLDCIKLEQYQKLYNVIVKNDSIDEATVDD